MAINLEKLRSDLGHADTQIQTFALMCITRLSPQIVQTPEEIQGIRSKLGDLVQSANPDVVFLARKAINHVEVTFTALLRGGAVAPGPVPVPPPVPVPVPVQPPKAATPVPVPAPAPPADAPMIRRDQAEAMSEPAALAALAATTDLFSMANLVIALVKIGSPRCLDAVAPLLLHADDRVRSNAVEVYTHHADASSVPRLLPLLEDPHNRVRANAVLALVKFQHPAAVKALENMLNSRMVSMRESATWALSQIPSPYAVILLARALQDPYEGVRLRAVRALGKFMTRESVELLKRALNDMDINVCEAAAESLRQIKARLTAQKAPAAPPTPAAAAPVPVPSSPPPAVDEASLAARAASRYAAPPVPVPAAPVPAAPVPAAPAPAPAAPAAPAPAPAQSIHGVTDLAEETAALADEHADDSGENLVEVAEVTRPAPTPEAAAAADEAGQGPREMNELDQTYHELGTVVYSLCRASRVSHEILDGIFYELLRFQDFLNAYRGRRDRGEKDPKVDENIHKLEGRVQDSTIQLGRQAKQLHDGKLIHFPDKDRDRLVPLVEKVRRLQRSRNK